MSIEAMKKALEALEMIDRDDNDRDFLAPCQLHQIDEAMIGLRSTISAAEKAEPIGYITATLLSEKDALLRQSLEALEGFVRITNDSQGVAGYHLNGDTAEWDEFDEVDAASNTIESIRNHLGVKND